MQRGDLLTNSTPDWSNGWRLATSLELSTATFLDRSIGGASDGRTAASHYLITMVRSAEKCTFIDFMSPAAGRVWGSRPAVAPPFADQLRARPRVHYVACAACLVSSSYGPHDTTPPSAGLVSSHAPHAT